MARRKNFTHDSAANDKAAAGARDPYENGNGLTYSERTCPACGKLVKVRTYPRATSRDTLERYPTHKPKDAIGRTAIKCQASRLTMYEAAERLKP